MVTQKGMVRAWNVWQKSPDIGQEDNLRGDLTGNGVGLHRHSKHVLLVAQEGAEKDKWQRHAKPQHCQHHERAEGHGGGRALAPRDDVDRKENGEAYAGE